MTRIDLYDAPLFNGMGFIPPGFSLPGPYQPTLVWLDGELWIDGFHWIRTFEPSTELPSEPVVMEWWSDAPALVVDAPVNVVPEPSGFGLLMVGLLALARWRRE